MVGQCVELTLFYSKHQNIKKSPKGSPNHLLTLCFFFGNPKFMERDDDEYHTVLVIFKTIKIKYDDSIQNIKISKNAKMITK